jgi:hypothetical protein
MIAQDLATEPQVRRADQPARGQDVFFRLRHAIGLSGDEFHPAGRAARIAATRVQLIDARLVFQRVHKSLVHRDFDRFVAFDGELGHRWLPGAVRCANYTFCDNFANRFRIRSSGGLFAAEQIG